MYLNILSKEQEELLPFLVQFNKKFVMVGGTAIALQIGHRKSIDFDLFCTKPINKAAIKKAVADIDFSKQLLFEDGDGIHYIINGVKVTFFYYPFNITGVIKIAEYIKIPDLLTLGAMKFYALGRRAKWKDYVDIYSLLVNNHITIPKVSAIALQLFKEAYAEKLFRQQLAYFEDIDYTETVEWISTPTDPEVIKKALLKYSLQIN